MEITDETLHFIAENIDADVRKLALKSASYPNINLNFALMQISGKQGIKNKIPAFFACKNIVFPPRISIEQTSSQATAQYKASLSSGKAFADLTGGFGCDSYFISRNFQEAFFVEQNEELCSIASHNFAQLNADNISVICTNAEKFITSIDEKIDLIYLDPARRSASGNKTVLISDCTPNVAQMAVTLITKAKRTLIKLSPLIDISAAIKELKYVSEVHVVSVENECKEVLFLLADDTNNEVKISAVNILKNDDKQIFSYILHQESIAYVVYANSLQKYLYEPNSAILKAGAFRSVSEKYQIQKLDSNTHLFTSDKIVENFPGRIFKIDKIYTFTKTGIKELKQRVLKANITTRNFPLSVSEIRRKTGLHEGGDTYIFASKFQNENLLISCSKI